MNKFKILALAALASLTSLAMAPATAGVVCDTCSYTGNPASNLGLHSTTNEDNSTFGNSTSGTNGDFLNTWVFEIAPAGASSVTAVFLPISNISNFDVKLYEVDSATCDPNTPTAAGACSAIDLGALLLDAPTPVNWASGFDFFAMDAGQYAFTISGTVAGLGPTQPASYTGNLQVQPQAVPEPGTLALAGLSLLSLGALRRKS